MKMPVLSTQLLHYAIVGVLSNFVGYMFYLFLTYLGGSPKFTMTFLYAIGALIGYLGNRKLTFSYRGGHFGALSKYLFAHILGYLLNLSILFLMVDKLGYNHQWVQGIAVFIVAGYLFIVFKLFVFKESKALKGIADESMPKM